MVTFVSGAQEFSAAAFRERSRRPTWRWSAWRPMFAASLTEERFAFVGRRRKAVDSDFAVEMPPPGAPSA